MPRFTDIAEVTQLANGRALGLRIAAAQNAGADAFRNATGTGGGILPGHLRSSIGHGVHMANEAQRAEDAAHAAKRQKYPPFAPGAGGPGQYQGLTPFVKGGGSWDTSSTKL